MSDSINLTLKLSDERVEELVDEVCKKYECSAAMRLIMIDMVKSAVKEANDNLLRQFQSTMIDIKGNSFTSVAVSPPKEYPWDWDDRLGEIYEKYGYRVWVDGKPVRPAHFTALAGSIALDWVPVFNSEIKIQYKDGTETRLDCMQADGNRSIFHTHRKQNELQAAQPKS